MKDYKGKGKYVPKKDFAPRKDFGPKEMYQATCSHCNKSCEVPFKPNGTKPVFCKDCFDTDRSGFVARPGARAPMRSRPTSAPDIQSQISELSAKMDRLIALVSSKVK